MEISKHIDRSLIARFNDSLPSYVHENNARVIMGQQPKYLRDAELKENNNPAQLLTSLNRLTGLMLSSSSLQKNRGDSGSRNIESEDQAKTRSNSTQRALNTFLKEGKDVISKLMGSLTKIASRIPKEKLALT